MTTKMSLSTEWCRDNRGAWPVAALMWLLIVLMIVPEGMNYESLITVAAPSSAGAFSRILWLTCLGAGVTLIGWRSELAWLQLRTSNFWLFAFLMLAGSSIAWSIDPTLSTRRLLRLFTIVVACTAFVLVSWHPQRFQSVVRPILSLVLLGSLIFGLVYPEYAIHEQSATELAGAWRGLANHKNSLGALASLSLIFWFHGWLCREVRFVAFLAGASIAMACLLLSRSSTSLAATVVVLAFVGLTLRAPDGLRPFVPHAVVSATAALLLYALLTLGLIPGLSALTAAIASLTGKDVTLTGRTEIWAILADHIRLHPWFGTGYAAYWTAAPTVGTDAYEFVRRMGSFYPGSAHNGYLDVANDLGAAGLLCLFGYAITHVRQTLQLMGTERGQATLYLAMFFQQAITNLSETHWFSVQSVDFVLMTLTTAALARSLLEHRLRAAFGEPDSRRPAAVRGAPLSADAPSVLA